MKLEPIIQSKVSQKRKTNIIYDHIYMESRKIVLMDLLSRQQRRHVKRRLLNLMGKREGGMI